MLLVIGANGFLGRSIMRHFRASGRGAIGASHAPGSEVRFDMRQPALPMSLLQNWPISHAVLCSSIIDIDRCRREQEFAWTFNVTNTIRLITQLQSQNVRVIYCSSDMVFDGTRGGYQEHHELAPTTEYGRQKKAVEDFLKLSGQVHCILRMSKLYSAEPHTGSVLHQMIAAIQSGGMVRAAVDQVVVPTYVHDIARTIAAITDNGLSGVFHVTPHTRFRRYDLLMALAQRFGEPDRITPCSLDDIPFLDKRPKNLWLDGIRTEERTGVHPVEFGAMLHELVTSVGEIVQTAPERIR